ncbi:MULTISPECIES: PEP-CTERM sorting domain-containing protein [unclassified Novosphingobium]|uniref:PEP-CTERM sorting domain-containing protein n=1 Tax=unclassified Novosphingobium TaxID=2644732 RepID=UPI000EE03E6D|nr:MULTISPECIES: PEP-CTERM sorting domain-containing protein [unclassified Novosphingobium]HCF24860.1 PEP-CTERM sorting domain-containing protein [Novosphingobium sp.]HQV04367.1 PEP-CTERM sorting domain-containing protein [Novosphingobium sp.]
MLGRIATPILVVLIGATPALAQSTSWVVPEPSGLALLGIGLAGVAAGRILSRKPPQN